MIPIAEKAQNLIEREARFTLSARDFAEFSRALDTRLCPLTPPSRAP
jgi:uncharacterized protein (DUF1778 family)